MTPEQHIEFLGSMPEPESPLLQTLEEAANTPGFGNDMAVWQRLSSAVLAADKEIISLKNDEKRRAHHDREDERLRAQILSALKDAYRHVHLGHDHLTGSEMGDILQCALCEAMGDDAFCAWLEEVSPEE